MNILLFNWRDPKNPKSGGAEIVTLYHASEWVKKGHKVTWFTSSFSNASKKELVDGVEIIRRGNFLTVFLLAPFFYFFSRTNWDIIIDEIHGIPFFTPLFVKKPKVAFIHEIAKEIWDYMYPFPINAIGKFLETFYLPLYRNVPIWTDAQSTVKELVDLGMKERLCVAIPCPSTAQAITVLPKKENDVTFLFVSRVVKMKGIEEVLKAFALIYKENSSTKLWIVGSGEDAYLKTLKKMTKEYGIEKAVVFCGKVSDEKKIYLMKHAHVLLHASVKEGWGLVVVEAASQGTPSIVYDVPGLRDSVKDGKTGILIKENSPREMARQALKLMSDKRRYIMYQKNGLHWAASLQLDKLANQSLLFLQKYV